MALSEHTMATVKATVPVIKAQGGEIVLEFYDTLFTRYPSVKQYFNMDRQKGGVTKDGELPAQVSAQVTAILSYAQNIDQVDKILPVVERICQKHVARGVHAVQYDAVGECLLAAFRAVLKDAATDEIMTAWEEAYGFLAGVFIDTEKRIKAENEARAGYEGFASVTVVGVEEGEAGKVLSVVPDDAPVPPAGEGQFVAFDIDLKDGEKTMTAMKLLPGGADALRIDVPRSGEKASLYLLGVKEGAKLRVSVPCGAVKKPKA